MTLIYSGKNYTIFISNRKGNVKMKIVLLIDHLSGFGGAQRVITNIANRMTEKGNEVEFILTGNNKACVYQLDNRIKINLIQDPSVMRMSKIKKIKKNTSDYKENTTQCCYCIFNNGEYNCYNIQHWIRYYYCYI